MNKKRKKIYMITYLSRTTHKNVIINNINTTQKMNAVQVNVNPDTSEELSKSQRSNVPMNHAYKLGPRPTRRLTNTI